MPPGPTVRTTQGDTMKSIRQRLYPHFLEMHVAKWERFFISMNQLWIIIPGCNFEGGVLLHMPNVDSFGVFFHIPPSTSPKQ
jgi:hypothetical protein